jgi:hypothetical protein
MTQVTELPPVGCRTCGAAIDQFCHTVDKPWNVYFGRTNGKLFVHLARVGGAQA